MAITPAMFSMLFSGTSSSGSVDFSFLTKSSSSSSGTATADVGTVKSALANAEKNEAKQLAQVANDPQILRDLARYEKVVKNANSLDDVLDDPVARTVFMTANGLKADINNVGMAKKVLASDPADKSSIAARLSSINGAWLDAVNTYNFTEYGIDRLSPKMDGFAGRWRIDLEREGEPIEAMLEISKARGGGWQAEVDGVPIPVQINGSSVTLDLLWEDAAEELHTTRLTGSLGKDGMTGTQADDGSAVGTWGAKPYFADAIGDISANYIAEKRLDMLDQQMPGLGSAVLFKSIAKNLKDATDILGSPLGREVITTAFNIPKQIAIQSMVAQEKAINQRLTPAKLQNDHFVDQIAQRYLIMLNGGLGGITA